MLEIRCNDIKLNKKNADLIQKINDIIVEQFKTIPLEKRTIRTFFLEEEEYYSRLGYEKPYRNLPESDGHYNGEYKEIFIKLNAKSIIRTYIHEVGHFIDYNLKTDDMDIKYGSAFSRKIYSDIPFEDKVIKDLKSMPAFTLLTVAAGKNYTLKADEIFARFFEVFIWEKLDRKHFTPDLYISTPKTFLFLNNWLGKNKNSFFFKLFQKIHLGLLKRAISKRSLRDPFNKDKFSSYIKEFLVNN